MTLPIICTSFEREYNAREGQALATSTALENELRMPEMIDEPNRCRSHYEANAEQPGQARFLDRRGLTLQFGPDFRAILLV